MADEKPKNYSTLYRDDIEPPIPNVRSYKSLDGARKPPTYVDLREVVTKLQNLPDQQQIHGNAMDVLSSHYTAVFKGKHQIKKGYKAYIKYNDEKDVFVVRIDHRTLKAVKLKLPKRGNFRYFFKQLDNTLEEFESDNSTLPVHEKEDLKLIYCYIFNS